MSAAQYCLVCASNESIFLDVTSDNQSTFGDQIETCLSAKINESLDLSDKICYKCAYELDQCAKFVQRCRKSHGEPGAETSKSCCFLCHELVKSDRIFDITKDTSIFNPLRKIRSIFNDDINKKRGDSKLICLTCRYNLDVLYDLKRIYQETIINLKALVKEEISYLDFPKIHTDVVNRKTTVTTFSDITFYGSINSDSDNEENMARNKRHAKARRTRSSTQTKSQNIKSKVRNCDKCYSAVANDIDMYRFHHTGLTVCKNCWLTMDPSIDRSQRRSRQTQSNLAETKLCAVFLTDVLSQESYKKDKSHETEKDKDDDNISYGSSQEEAKSSEDSPLSISSKTRNHIVNGKAKQGKKRKIDLEKSNDDVERTPLKVTRLSKERENADEMKSTKPSVDVEQQSSSIRLTRGHKRIIDDRSSDSDSSLKQRELRRIKLNDHVNKTNKKKQKSILEGTTSNAHSDTSDETSNDNNTNLRSRIKSTTSSSTTPTKTESDRNTRSRTRSSSMSSIEMTSAEFKSPKSLIQSEVKTEYYTCDKCNKKFDTKLSNAKHKLSHLKQAALKLEKLTVPSVKEKQETELDSQDEKISEETTSRSRTTSVDKRTNDPAEEIGINIEDDTDDEEIFSLSNRGNAKKKIKKEISDKGDDVIDKDVTKNKSRIEEESANDDNIQLTESEKCENSTPDETLEIENDEDRQDKDIRNEHTTKDKDKTSANRDSDKSKDMDVQKITVATLEDCKNVDKKKDKDVETKNDMEVSSTEKNKVISEFNNDEDNLHEEITSDNETSRSPILSIRNRTKDNKDHSENCINNLENNCKNDKDEIIDETQYDLINESSKEDTKESEEKIRQILPTDETLSDKNDLDDIIVNKDKVEELEDRQNKFVEEDIEMEIIADDKPNSAKDRINPDLSNGDKQDEIKGSDEDDIAVVSINSDSNDDIKYKRVMEETDDSKGKRKLEEELKELEDLVESNEMNEYEVQENSTYVPDNSSADAANEILKEVFELAAAEVQQREDSSNTKNLDEVEMETLENISREIRKSADMPSLDPISVMDIDDDTGIMLN